MNTCAHSIHSLMATNNLPSKAESNLTCSRPERIRIYYKEAIELASTSAFDYFEIKFSSELTKFRVYGSYGAISNILGTLSTAVFLT